MCFRRGLPPLGRLTRRLHRFRLLAALAVFSAIYVPIAFAVVRDASRIADAAGVAAMQQEVMQTVDRELGAIGRPARVHFVTLLPKTRSGKLLRRSIQALAEGRDPGDLTTIEDPGALEQIRAALGGPQGLPPAST